MHLDKLLAQGTSQAIQDEIIALSEEFHIITPYTSLLVLESDADRERFKVKRRFQMRDGEQFFAEGRDKAQYELVQQQMQRAGLWRLGLRRAGADRRWPTWAASGSRSNGPPLSAGGFRQRTRPNFDSLIDSISNTVAPTVGEMSAAQVQSADSSELEPRHQREFRQRRSMAYGGIDSQRPRGRAFGDGFYLNGPVPLVTATTSCCSPTARCPVDGPPLVYDPKPMAAEPIDLLAAVMATLPKRLSGLNGPFDGTELWTARNFPWDVPATRTAL